MKFLLACAVLVITVFLFNSCQRDVDGQLNTTNSVNTKDSIYISKRIELDTTLASGSDTLSADQFYYDAAKRLLHLSSRDYKYGTHNLNATFDEYRFYSGSDTVPYKTVLITYDAVLASTANDTTFLFYNSNRLIIKDSTVDYYNNILYSKERNDFSLISSGRYLIKNSKLDITTGAILGGDSTISNINEVNNNLIADTDSVYNGGVLMTVYKYNAAYTLKFSPFYRLNIPYSVHNAQYYFSFNLPNSESFQELTGGSAYNDFFTYQFEYNSLGYPTILRNINPSSSNTAIKQLIYYTN